jgi:transposase
MLTPSPLFPIAIRLIRLDHGTIVLDAHGLVRRGRCPACGATSARVHDRYRRSPTDLPWRAYSVRLHVTVRRFRCDNPACRRRTFAEDFGPQLARGARRTADVRTLLVDLAESAGGEAGARLARAAGLLVSPDTLLRLLRHSNLDSVPTPRVLGVDDLALRRRHSYATILVDLATHRPVDLLKGRDADMLAAWLRAHPGIEIIVRDRAEAYADGARLGAPDALQVADRFHLVQNASNALEELLKAQRRRIAVMVTEPGPPPDAPRPLSPRQQQVADRRAARIARWTEVRRRHGAGESLQHIARTMGINRRTATWMARQELPPEHHVRHPRPAGLSSPSLQPYVGYLQDRWQAGCTNISQLYREISARGYGGSRSLLSTALQAWRSSCPTPTERKRTRYVSVRWLCLRPPEDLKPDEQPVLEQVLADDTDLASGYRLLQRFRTLIANRSVPELETWLLDAAASGLAPFVSLANGIRDDYAAVEAALTSDWSNGPVEGHVHRVKLIKRQGYGRAGFALLRRRVLAA